MNVNRDQLRPDYPGAVVLLWCLRVLVVLAIGLAAYMSWQSFTTQLPAGCGANSGCGSVLSSRWSKIGPLPVSVPAVLVYVTLLVVSFLLPIAKRGATLKWLWISMVVIAFMLIGSIGWYSYLQIVVLKSFCVYCMAAHILGFIISFVIFMLVPFAQKLEDGFVRSEAFTGLVLGVFAVLVFIGFQLLIPAQTDGPKKINVVATQPIEIPLTQPEDVQATQPKQTVEVDPSLFNKDISKAALKGKRMALVNGFVKLPMGAYPVFGSIDAPHHIAIMIDYACPHCRDLHADILAWMQRHPGQLMVMVLPVPLNPACNNAYERELSDRFKDSCTYAKIGLALHHFKPEASGAFDQFMFQGDSPPSLAEAKAYAEKLAGREIDSLMASERTDKMLKQSVHMNNKVMGGAALPVLIMPKGQPESGRPETEELEKMFELFKSGS